MHGIKVQNVEVKSAKNVERNVLKRQEINLCLGYPFSAALCYNCPDAVKSFNECSNTTTCAQDEVGTGTIFWRLVWDSTSLLILSYW